MGGSHSYIIDTMEDNLQPWDRRPGETAKAFQGFQAFRDLGPARTIQAAGEALVESGGIPSFTIGRRRWWEKWSTRHDWVARAQAWDDHLDEVGQLAQEEEVIQMNRRHAEVARKAQELAAERLAQLDPSALPPHLVIRFLEVAMKLERVAMGEVESIQALQIDLDKLSDEELEALANGGT